MILGTTAHPITDNLVLFFFLGRSREISGFSSDFSCFRRRGLGCCSCVQQVETAMPFRSVETLGTVEPALDFA